MFTKMDDKTVSSILGHDRSDWLFGAHAPTTAAFGARLIDFSYTSAPLNPPLSDLDDVFLVALPSESQSVTQYASNPVESGTINPSITTIASGNQYIDGILIGGHWAGTTINYAFPISSAAYDYTGTGLTDLPANFAPISLQVEAAAHFIMSASEGVAASSGFSVEGFTSINIDFEGNADTQSHIRFGETSSSSVNTARVGDFPGSVISAPLDDDGDIWFGVAYAGDANYDLRLPQAGNYAWLTNIHEVGHALGLKHSQDNGYSFGAVPADRDAMEYTVMSYRSYINGPTSGGYTNEAFGFAQTFMMLDIAALQYLYGADFTSNSGDTTYSWTPSSGDTLIDGVVSINPGDNRIFATIWDGDGIDTYDLSAYASDLQIDLSPGGVSLFSTVQQATLGYSGQLATGNIYNALQFNGDVRSLIENAIGGSGNDLIVGNVADNHLSGGAGDDTLNGGDGDDLLTGGLGADTLNGGDGIDTVDYSDSSVGVVVKVLPNSGVGGTADGDTYVDIENVIGSDFNDLIEGTGGINVIDGGNGNDDLYGFAGADTLLGGSGNDRLRYVVSNGDFLGTFDGGTDTDELYIFGGAASADMRGATITEIETLTFEAGFNNDYGVQFDVSQFIFVTIETGTSRGTETLNIDLFMNLDTIVDFGSLAFVNFGTVNDTLSIFGDADVETITGSSVNDIIDGGDGGDNLDGGAGSNTISYASSDGNVTINLEAQTASGNHADGDTLTNFQNAIGSAFDDIISGSSGDNILMGGLGIDTVSYASATAGVTIDMNLSTQQDTIGAGLDTLSGFEAIVGSAFADNIRTTTIAITVHAGDGNDYIFSRGRPDIINAGEGNDTVAASVFYGAGGSFDGGYGIDLLEFSFVLGGANPWTINLDTEIFSYIGGPTSQIDILNFENVSGTQARDIITGNTLANVLNGNAGDDQIFGGIGNDTLIGGLGADLLDGGDGTDTADYSAASSALRVDLTTGTVSGYALGDTFVDIENLIGGAFNDFLTGTSIRNIIEGGAGVDEIKGLDGNDTLIGGDGDDKLYGNADNDTLIGGLGADLLHGGTGLDTVSYVDATTALRANLTTGTVGGYALGDTFVDIENLIGGAFNDFLTGTSSSNVIEGGDGIDDIKGLNGNDTLIGGAGDDLLYGNADQDTLIGGLGADLHHGGNGTDTASYVDATTVVRVDLYNGNVGGYALGDTFVSIENLTGGDFNDILTGDANANLIRGGDGNDTLKGLDGNDNIRGGDGDDIIYGNADNDTLRGEAGDDTIYGGSGNDTFLTDDGADTYVGGGGFDRVTYKQSSTGIYLNMFNTALGTGWAAGDVLIGIKKIEGSLFDDIMTGGLLNDSLYGEAGDDELNGGQGNDRLFGGDDNDTLGGGSGSDKLFGEDGDDILFGGTDNDQLYGGDGDDILRGGDGFDTLIGGEGADQFIGGAGFDRATYKQATTGLTIDMSDAMNSTLEALGDTFVEIELLEATNYDDIITGSDAGDRITALDGNDTMYGGLGDDKLFGGDGVDTIFGGDGSDKLFGGAGNDILTGGTGRDIYQLGASEGQDTITDFNQAESDIIVFTNASGANAIGDLTIASTNGGADTLIIYAEGSILLEGIDSSLIGAADFNFV